MSKTTNSDGDANVSNFYRIVQTVTHEFLVRADHGYEAILAGWQERQPVSDSQHGPQVTKVRTSELTARTFKKHLGSKPPECLDYFDCRSREWKTLSDAWEDK